MKTYLSVCNLISVTTICWLFIKFGITVLYKCLTGVSFIKIGSLKHDLLMGINEFLPVLSIFCTSFG
jgi:hypothetical protein